MINRFTTAAGLVLTAGSALADPGHIATERGHDHYELLIGLAVIAILGVPLVVRAIRRRR